MRAAFRKLVCHHFKTDISERIPYMKLSQFSLTLLGLWPYSNKIIKFSYYMAFFVWTVVSISIWIEGLFEVTIWDPVVSYGTIAAVLWMLSSLIVATTLYIGEASLKKLYDGMISNWKAIKDVEELAIMEDFARRATIMSGKYTVCGFIGGILFLSLNYLSLAYDSADEHSKSFISYSKHWIIVDDLFEFQIIVHSILIACFGAFLYNTVLHAYLYSVEHTCGLFAIVCYRLQKLTKPNEIELVNNVKRDDEIIYESLIDIIVKHKKAIRSCDIVGKTFNTSLYILQIVGLLFTSVFIFGIQLGFHLKSIHTIVTILPWIGVILHYGFYLNYGGQQVIDYSNKVFMDTWSCMSWESMSIKSRKIVLLLMLRSSQPCALKTGLITLSLENFSKLVNLSWSLSTVIFSTQNNGVR